MNRPAPSVNLERVADNLADNDHAVIDDFLNHDEIVSLRELVRFHLTNDNFKPAGIGRAEEFEVDRSVRGDYIKWLDPADARPAAANFLERINEMRQQLNRLLYLSMVDFECHLALYPPGSFYERHLDQFRNRNFRKLSFVIYLNENWQPGDGGELVLYLPEEDKAVEPLAGRMVLFRSDTLEHEVLVTNTDRLSITGWMLDRPLDWPIVQ